MDLIVHSSIIPTCHNNVRSDKVAILYAICDPTTRVDLASLIFSLILPASQDISSSDTLLYGVLITRICQSACCREKPTNTHQPYISPLDERTITRSDAQIRGAAKRAWASTKQAEATTEEDPTEHTFGILDELRVEQGRQREELQGLRDDFQGFCTDYQRDMGSMHHIQRYMFEL